MLTVLTHHFRTRRSSDLKATELLGVNIVVPGYLCTALCHDPLPRLRVVWKSQSHTPLIDAQCVAFQAATTLRTSSWVKTYAPPGRRDRKSTRLNSSH